MKLTEADLRHAVAYRADYPNGHHQEAHFATFKSPATAREVHMIAATIAGRRDVYFKTRAALLAAGFGLETTELEARQGSAGVKPGANGEVLVQISNIVYLVVGSVKSEGQTNG